MNTNGAEATYRVSSSPLADWTLKRVLSARSNFVLRLRSMLTREQFLQSGTVSIILPFYNVEQYLRATLESIRLQRYQDLQVILVDDASTDNSAQIAAEYVRRDDRFTLTSSSGVGPGGARNAGLALANGDFIAFVDGDDILPFGAMYLQIAALQDQRIAFVVGAFEHLEESHRWRSSWVAREHAKFRSPVTLADVPGITRNVFPWNKLFRREFFERTIGHFPTSTVYEDQVPTARAYASGERFAVLPETVYHWRRRASKDSITQNRSKLDHLEARVRVLHEVRDVYTKADAGAYREWLKKSLFEDMRPFFEAAQFADSAYRSLLSRTCTWLWNLLSREEQTAASSAETRRTMAVMNGDFSLLQQLDTL